MPTLQLINVGTANHPTFGPVAWTGEDIGWDADQQVARTLGIMGQRVREDAADPGFCYWAQQIVGAVPGEIPDMDVVEAAYSHVKGVLQFQRDEVTGAGVGNYPAEEVVEVLIRPREMAKFVAMGVGTGDCDDFTMYLAGILTCYRIPVEFCTVAADGRAPNNYSHVYLVAYPGDGNGVRGRLALDASHGEYPGWEVANMFGRRKQWPVSTTGSWLALLPYVVIGAAAAWFVMRTRVA
jgi:hypothetical protein